MPALYGGLLIATLWAVPGLNLINCLCCAGVLLGGLLSVVIYQKDFTPETEPMVMQDCIQLGIIAGVIASVAAVVIQLLVAIAFGNIAIDMMMHLVNRMHVELPPEFFDLIDQAKSQKPNLIGSFMAIFIYIIPNSLFAMLGALIGWNIFKPKQ